MAFLLAFLLGVVLLASCSSGSAGPGPAGTGAAGSGTAGRSVTGTAGTGSTGAGGTSAMGAAGVEGAAGANGRASGAAGETGAAGTTFTGDAGATYPDAGGGSDARPVSHGDKVLIYTRSTGFVHDSTPTAAMAIANAATAAGLVPELSADVAKFAPAALAQYGAVVLIATAGEPFGSPGTMQIQTLVDFVNGGGGLVAIENANHAYDSSALYVGLIGDDFAGHSDYGPNTCYKDGDHPTNMRLPATFPVIDEIYFTAKFNVANQVVLRCGSDRRPISWVRQQGSGRVFYTALGHAKESWTNPPLVDGHVLPGLLWTMSRPVP